ncbi:MAG: DNA polymerase III subunit gamma/tau [Bacillota bacterium]
MSYIALYRKWRPQDFTELIGQDHISRTLKNALAANKIAHAYLLCGPRGTGKTTTAKIIAKSINCLQPVMGEPCNQCMPCKLINAGNSMDVLEIDGASNRGIDEIRDLREKVNLAPAQGKYKVYIIDEVHMLTTEAFNALLKTLEEPPKFVMFILATTEPHKVPATILSRCQRFDFHRLDQKTISAKLEEICLKSDIEYAKEGLDVIARLARGGMRDALSLMDQCLSYGEQRLLLPQIREALGLASTEYVGDLVNLLLLKDAKGLLEKLDILTKEGKEIRQLANQVLDYLRNLIIYKTCGEEALADAPDEEKELFKKHEDLKLSELSFAIECVNKAEEQMRWSSNPRLLLEMAFFKYMYQQKEEQMLHVLYEKVQFLEKELETIKTKGTLKSHIMQKGLNKPIDFKGEALLEEGKLEEDQGGDKDMEEVRPSRSSPSYVDLETIKASWKKVLDLVRRNKVTTHAFLVVAEPIEYQNGCLTLRFASNYSFHREKIEQPENKKIIEDILGYLLKEKVAIKCVTAQTGKADSAPSQENILESAIKIFGGTLIE